MEELIKEKNPTPTRYQRSRLIKKIFKLCPQLKKEYFLEICGTGEILTFLDQLNMRGEGIDLSKDAVKIAKERVSKNIKVNAIDFLNIKNKKYGLIIMLDVLEHIKNDDNFVHHANSLLTDEKYFLINVPAKMKLFALADIYFGHYRRYEKRDLIKLLEKNGFKIIKFWSYGITLTGKIFSYLIKEKVKKDKNENTLKSGHKTPKFMKYLYPFIGKFYWILNFQDIFLNTNFGSQYLILAKKLEKR